jgi:hypothetical protein
MVNTIILQYSKSAKAIYVLQTFRGEKENDITNMHRKKVHIYSIYATKKRSIISSYAKTWTRKVHQYCNYQFIVKIS